MLGMIPGSISNVTSSRRAWCASSATSDLGAGRDDLLLSRGNLDTSLWVQVAKDHGGLRPSLVRTTCASPSPSPMSVMINAGGLADQRAHRTNRK